MPASDAVNISSVAIALGTLIIFAANWVERRQSKKKTDRVVVNTASATIPKQILYVDDDPDDVALAVRLFRSMGVTNPVVTFDSPEQVLIYLQNRDDVAFVMADIKMTSNGHRLLENMKFDRKVRDIPVIVISGSAPVDVTMYQLGAICFFEKPLSFNQLMQCLNLHGFSCEIRIDD